MKVLMQVSIVIVLVVISYMFYMSSYANEELQLGARYKVIHPIYLVGAYNSNSPNNSKLSRETARAYLDPIKYARRYYHAFQVQVPVGTVMTIASSVKRVWHIPYLVDKYIVTLDPDLSQGLDIEMTLDRGMDGSMDGLNPELFERW